MQIIIGFRETSPTIYGLMLEESLCKGARHFPIIPSLSSQCDKRQALYPAFAVRTDGEERIANRALQLEKLATRSRFSTSIPLLCHRG